MILEENWDGKMKDQMKIIQCGTRFAVKHSVNIESTFVSGQELAQLHLFAGVHFALLATRT